MARTLSTAMRGALIAEATAEIPLAWLDITLEGGTHLYVVGNDEALTRNGNVHLPYQFEITLPDEVPEQVPIVELRIANADQIILAQLVDLVEPIPIIMAMALASTPNTDEIAIPMEISSSSWTDSEIVAELLVDDDMLENYPGWNVTPGNHLAIN